MRTWPNLLEMSNEEDKKQFDLLHAPIGEKASGRVRYAAAMYFFQRRMLSDEVLEIYRICSKQDNEDPKDRLSTLEREDKIAIKGVKP